MYKCLDCGEVFESPKTFKENQGYYGETIAYEECYCCPHCGGSYAEAYRCEECEEWFTEDEISNGYCDHCYEKIFEEIATPKNAYQIAKDNDMFERIELNSFLYFAFSKDEIEEILFKELKNNTDCAKDFLFDYEDETIKFYEQEVK